MAKLLKSLLSLLAVAATVLALLAAPAWAEGEEPADEDLSELLNEAPDAAGLGQDESGGPWGVRFEGELRANVWYQYGGEHEWKTTNRLDLLAEKQLDALKLLGRLKLDYQNLQQEPDFRADPRELYGQYRLQASWFNYLDLTAGKRILYWGKGDEIRPVDIANPEDMTSYLFYLKNERKTGVLGLFADWAINRFVTVEAFWSPYFQKSWTPDLGDYFEPHALRALHDAGIGEGSAIAPDSFSDMASAGGRLKLSVERFDIGLYAYQGYSNMPTYEVSALARHPLYGLPIIPTQVSPKYYRTTMYGLDFERALGDFVFRGELAWFADGNQANIDWAHDPTLLLKRPSGVEEAQELQYVAGVDKNDLFIRHLYVNVQYVGQYILDYEDYFTEDQATHGMTLSTHYSMFDSKLKFRYWLVCDFTNHTYRNLLEGTYKINNWSEVSLGTIFYDGDADTLFGQYDNKDYVYTQLKLIF